MTILVVLILLCAVSFGVREYSFAFRKRIKSSTSETIKLTNWNEIKSFPQTESINEDEDDDGKNKDEVVKIQNNSVSLAHQISVTSSKNNLISGLTQFTDKADQINNNNVNISPPPWIFDVTKKIEFPIPSKSTETEIKSEKECYGKDFPSGFTDKSISKFTRKPVPATMMPPPKQTYSINHLINLNKSKNPVSEVLLNISKYKQKHKIAMSTLLNCPVSFPCTSFENAWQASKIIRDAETDIIETSNSKSTKLISLIKILSIGRSLELMDNPNIFLEAFNDCIENLVDMGHVFTFLAEGSVALKILLMESLLTYSWSHYRFHDLDMKNKQIKVQFTKWKLPHPIIQTRNTIFKILCNLQLGLNTNPSVSEDSEIENGLKLGLVIRELINHSVCNDYIGYVPMIAQAIDISNIDRNKFFFYEILKLLVAKHMNCCMGEYIQESNLELKALIQYGLSTSNVKMINDKVKEILTLLITNDERIISWKINTNKLKNYISSAIPLSTEHTEKYFSAPLFKQHPQQQPIVEEEPTSGSTEVSLSNSWKIGIVSSDLGYSPDSNDNQMVMFNEV
ncbi:hypothetical protein SBY92_003515 [Candida maltosa Xu316]